MPSILRVPKVQLIISLFLIYITAIIKFPNPTTFYLIVSCIGFNIFFDLLFTYLRKGTLFIPYAAIVSGLIMALIVDPSANIFQIAITAALAMGIKNFLRISGRHPFNPVAAGLFIGGFIFSQNTSWWGVSFQNISQFNLQNLLFFLILLLPGLISFLRLKKYPGILSYLITSITISRVSLFDPSTLFFALVMLPEPMTSPVTPKNQIIYGVLIAVIPLIFSLPILSQLLQTTAFDPPLFALLLGNLIFFKNR